MTTLRLQLTLLTINFTDGFSRGQQVRKRVLFEPFGRKDNAVVSSYRFLGQLWLSKSIWLGDLGVVDKLVLPLVLHFRLD